MTEPLAIHYIASRARELGWTDYRLKYRDFTLGGHETRLVETFTEMFVLVGADKEVKVQSDLGVYDKTGNRPGENQHEHLGQIQLVNTNRNARNVTFIQVLWMKRAE